jgi:hypothetical protein
MFGLLRPQRRLLNGEDRRDHSSAYCNLCASLSYCYGVSSRLLVVHDVATADWLLSGQRAEPRLFPIANCVRGGVRSVARPACLSARQRFLAALSAYTVGVKVADDLSDHGTGKARLAQAIYGPVFARARRDLAVHGFDVAAFEAVLATQRQVEESGETDLDAASAPSGLAFALVARHLARQHGEGVGPGDASRLGDWIGRSVFLADACQDLERDLIAGAYNPLRAPLDRTANGEDTDRRREALTYLGHFLNQARIVCGRLGPGVARRWHATEPTLWSVAVDASRRKRSKHATRPGPGGNADAPAEERKKPSLPPPTSELLAPTKAGGARSSCCDDLAGCCGATCGDAICKMCCDVICNATCASV